MEVQSSIKESPKSYEKVWGEEIWLVNNDQYCAKWLILHKGAMSSLHYHKTKRETFYCIQGYASLIVDGKRYILAPLTSPVTIRPEMKHKFEGITDAIILEVSTHHSEEDVVRLSESRGSNVQKQ